MASNSGVQRSFQLQFTCQECGLGLKSAESLEGHRRYHKLLQQWAVKARGSGNEEKHNNMTKQPAAIKREFAYQQQQQQSHYQNFSNFPEQQQQFFSMGSNNHYSQDIHSNKASFRYQPYGHPQYYKHSKPSVGALQVSPAYPPQPTPSPSPKQCDKCGYVCESAAQLIEHNNLTHSNNAQYNHSNHFMFDRQVVIKEKDTSQSEIFDVDSLVHPDWVDGKEGDKRPNGDPGIPLSVSAMFNSWPPQAHQQFQGEHNMYINDTGEQKIFPNLNSIMQKGKMFSTDQKLFPWHQMDNQNFMNNTVSSSNQEMGSVNQQSYRAFEHLPTTLSSVITSTQEPQVLRPKTYNCTTCYKWLTSPGHLKRHYQTCHKNAIKSRGQPDPATMPISVHQSPREDSRGDDSNGMCSQYDNRLSSMPGLLQHPPNGPYDRQGMHHTPPMHSFLGHHHAPLTNPSPLGAQMMQNPGFSSLANGSPPDAGLSPQDLRGLLSMAPATHSFNMISQPHMMPMETAQFQMYPNGSAPHVTQATDTTTNFSTSDEHKQCVVQTGNQPLPSFEPVTALASFTYFTTDGFDFSDLL